MRTFLLSSLPIMLWVFAAVHAVFLVVFIRRYKATKEILFLLSALVTVGLLFDAFILSLGTVLTEGALFQSVSRVRFVSHGALIPLLFPICAYALNWKSGLKKAVWVLTAVIMVLGIAEGFCKVLEAREVANVWRYAASDMTPAWVAAVSSFLSYGTVIPLILAGIWVWIKQKTPALFLSGFLMFAFSALGPATGNFDLIFFISMIGEICMVLFFLIYANHKVSH